MSSKPTPTKDKTPSKAPVVGKTMSPATEERYDPDGKEIYQDVANSPDYVDAKMKELKLNDKYNPFRLRYARYRNAIEKEIRTRCEKYSKIIEKADLRDDDGKLQIPTLQLDDYHDLAMIDTEFIPYEDCFRRLPPTYAIDEDTPDTTCKLYRLISRMKANLSRVTMKEPLIFKYSFLNNEADISYDLYEEEEIIIPKYPIYKINYIKAIGENHMMDATAIVEVKGDDENPYPPNQTFRNNWKETNFIYSQTLQEWEAQKDENATTFHFDRITNSFIGKIERLA